MAEWEAAALEALADDSRSRGVGFRAVAAGATCPYKGLAAFQPQDAAFFFGREALVDELVARLQSSSVLVIGGPSGSGKSSLLRAGLVPAHRRRGAPGQPALARVGVQSRSRSARRVGAAALAARPRRAAPISGADLAADPRSRARLRAHGSGADRDRPVRGDLHAAARARRDRDAFLEVLATLTRSRATPGARRDRAPRRLLLGRRRGIPWLADRISDNQVLVGPMRRRRAAARDRGSRRNAPGCGSNRGLTEAILDEAGDEPGSLPLISHALMETWRRRRGTVLTVDGFRAAGGVVGAIAQSAEDAYERLDERGTRRGAPVVPAARDARRGRTRHAAAALVGRDRRSRDPRHRRHAGDRPPAHRRRARRRARARDAHPILAPTARVDRREPRRSPHPSADHPGRGRMVRAGSRSRTCCSAARRSRPRSSGARTAPSGSPRRLRSSSTRASAARDAEEAAAAAERSAAPARSASRVQRALVAGDRGAGGERGGVPRAASFAGQGGRSRGSLRSRARHAGRVARGHAAASSRCCSPPRARRGSIRSRPKRSRRSRTRASRSPRAASSRGPSRSRSATC